MLLICAVFVRDSITEPNSNPAASATSCKVTDDCEDQHFCYGNLCYPHRQYKETCQINEQCPVSVICREEVCLCEDGYKHNEDKDKGQCLETEEHKQWRKEEEKKKKNKNKQMLVWSIVGIAGAIIAVVAVIVIRHRIRKNKVRMNIQERRKSVLEQSRDPSVCLPMSTMNAKRKFSQHYTERF